MPFIPYQILHLDLDRSTEQAQPDGSTRGHYYVFWWKTLPLGHLFLKPGKTPSATEWRNRMTDAIAPALDYYAGSAAATGKALIKNMEESAWQQWAGTHLSSQVTEPKTAIVPVSVIICTRNRPEVLTACIASIKEMPCQPQEIIIIDNAPSDDRTEKAVHQFEGIRYAVEANPGLSYARNLGVKLATQPVIAFTDDDVQVHSHWMYRVWSAFQDPEVSAITGLVLASELETPSQLIFEQRWPFNRGYEPKRYDKLFLEEHKGVGAPVWDLGAGANMAFRKEAFMRYGDFDVRLGAGASGCNEDSEMWFRVLRSEGTILYTPAAVVFHQHRREISGLNRQIFQYMRGFVVATMVQHHQWPEGGYGQRVHHVLPLYYARMLKRALPFFPSRYRTLPSELNGIVSGYLHYLRMRRNLKNITVTKNE